jgi:hypothetical protein
LSNKGVLIADIYIRTTVYINLKNIPHSPEGSCTKPISKDKNVMVQTRKHYFKKTLFDLEVKGQGPRKVIMVHDTPPYGDLMVK